MTKTMWAVGPDDGEGWASINAPTEQAAKDAYAEENDCGTDWLTANRIEAWDGLEQITGPDWLTNGHGWRCECGGMAFADDGGVVIGGKVYCEDCAAIRKGGRDDMTDLTDDEVKALVAEAVAAERERCIAIAVRHWEGEPEDTIAMAAEMRVGMTPLSDYEKKVAQMREDFPNGI